LWKSSRYISGFKSYNMLQIYIVFRCRLQHQSPYITRQHSALLWQRSEFMTNVGLSLWGLSTRPMYGSDYRCRAVGAVDVENDLTDRIHHHVRGDGCDSDSLTTCWYRPTDRRSW